jgi:hypothetical protein
MKPKKLIGRLSDVVEDSPFPEDEDYDDFHTPSVPVCPIIRYDNVSYVCIKRDEKCTGYCPSCGYGVRI